MRACLRPRRIAGRHVAAFLAAMSLTSALPAWGQTAMPLFVAKVANDFALIMGDYGKKLGIFQREGHAHAATDAQSRDAALGITLKHLVQERDGDACAGASDRMPERDGATIHIELVAIEIQHTIAGQYLSCERFVQFNQPETMQP